MTPKLRSEHAWELSALCVDVDPEIFLPPSTNGVAIDWSEARAVCRHCPVKKECLDATPADDRFTMRGGLTPQERAALKPRPRTSRQLPIRHGTPGGARAHTRRGESACDSCKQAARLANRVREERTARKESA